MGHAGVPGVRRLREHAAAPGADVAAAVERQPAAPVRRLAHRGELPRQPLDSSVARDRAEPGGVWPGRDDRQYEPAPRPVSPESAAGAILRDDRATGRYRPRELQGAAPVPAEAVEEQPQRAVELDD